SDLRRIYPPPEQDRYQPRLATKGTFLRTPVAKRSSSIRGYSVGSSQRVAFRVARRQCLRGTALARTIHERASRGSSGGRGGSRGDGPAEPFPSCETTTP